MCHLVKRTSIKTPEGERAWNLLHDDTGGKVLTFPSPSLSFCAGGGGFFCGNQKACYTNVIGTAGSGGLFQAEEHSII